MKKILLGIIALTTTMSLMSCGGPKKVNVAGTSSSPEGVAVNLVFSGDKYKTDNDFFRANNSGVSTDHAMAKDIALMNAKSEIATSIQTMMDVFGKQYLSNTTVGDNMEARRDFQRNLIENAKASLQDVRVQDEKMFYKEENKRYTYYIAIEIPKKSLLEGIKNKVSNEDKLKLKFDEKQFDDFIKNYRQGSTGGN